MDPGCLQFALTDDERRTFNETGLLMLEEALPPERVAALTAAADRIYERRLAEGFEPNKALFFPNFIPEDDLFLDLVDYERVLPKVWGSLGWDIYLYHCRLIVTPPLGEEQPERPKSFGWHQDSGRV